MRYFALLLSVLLVTGCTSPRKTFKPPSSAKVDASTKKVKEAARTAKRHVEDAQKSADKIAVMSLSIQQKLDQIARNAPPELQPLISAVKGDVAAMQTEETSLIGFLDSAHKRQDDLEGKITVLESDQQNYYTDAQGLANEATNERNKLIVVEKQLIQQKIFGWLWKLGGVLILLLIAGLIFLWFTGKLAFKFAR